MQQTLFIIILVIVLILAYGWKKKRVNKMNDDLDVLIAADDWDGVCRILRKQLIIWGSLFMFSMVVLVVRIMDGGQFYTHIIVCAFLAWRFLKVLHLYIISYQNKKTMEGCDNMPPQVSVCDFLHDCKVTRIDVGSTEIKQLWLDAYERGRREGFCPVLLAETEYFCYNFDDNSEWFDENGFWEWKSKVLNADINYGSSVLQERIRQVKETYDDEEWQNYVVGTDERLEPVNDFDIVEGAELYLVEVPVKEPWQVFAYIPVGDWNECPMAEEHMAIARYWYERYGARVAYISDDVIGYYLPSPVTGDTMSVAEEHLGYSADVLQDGSLTSLAFQIKESTVWHFWWD